MKIPSRIQAMDRTACIFMFFLTAILLTGPGLPVLAQDTPTLEDIEFKAPSPSEEQITFKLNGTYIPKIFAIKGKKPRVVFDFPKTRAARTLNNIIKTNGKFIRQIRVGIHQGEDPKTRVVLDLYTDQEIDFTQKFDQQANALTVTVFHAGSEQKDQKSESPQNNEKKKESPAQARRPQATQPSTPAQQKHQTATRPDQQRSPSPTLADNQPQSPALAPITKPAPPAPREKGVDNPGQQTGKAPVLEWVKFDNSSNRGEMIQFKLNDFYPPIVFGIEEGLPRVVCDFKDTVTKGAIKGTIKTDGRYVRTIRIGKHKNPDKIRVVIDLEPNNSYDLQQVFFKEDNLFVIIVNTMNNTPPVSELEKPLQQ